MKALLLKNLYSNKMYKYIMIIAISVGFTMIFNIHHDYTYLFWMNLLMFINFRLSFVNNHSMKWDMYVKTLPVNSKKIVISQYISFMFHILLSVITFALVNVFYGLSSELDFIRILNDTLILFTMNIFLQSIACFILYSCDDKKSYILYTFVNAVLIVFFIFRGSEFTLCHFIYTTSGFICMLASLIIYAVSLFISISLYSKYSRRMIEMNI